MRMYAVEYEPYNEIVKCFNGFSCIVSCGFIFHIRIRLCPSSPQNKVCPSAGASRFVSKLYHLVHTWNFKPASLQSIFLLSILVTHLFICIHFVQTYCANVQYVLILIVSTYLHYFTYHLCFSIWTLLMYISTLCLQPIVFFCRCKYLDQITNLFGRYYQRLCLFFVIMLKNKK